MDESVNLNLREKRFRIHWHGYDHINDMPQKDTDFYMGMPWVKDTDFYMGMSWVDAVNQFLDNRFSHGPKYFYIDSYEEWDSNKEDRYDV